jgi:hypothetical protein
MSKYILNLEDADVAFYERDKTGELFVVVCEKDNFGRVVIRNLRGNEFAVEKPVLDNLYTRVDEREGRARFGSVQPKAAPAVPADPLRRFTVGVDDPREYAGNAGVSIPWGAPRAMAGRKGGKTDY